MHTSEQLKGGDFMKKQISIVIIFVVLMATLLTGCNDPRISHSTDGNIHFFVAEKEIDYLNYLERFDYNKFEIIDITPDTYRNRFTITFRNKTE